ncbi:MAG TPA: outer membrane protein assembly factor BamD [Solimonas sp.]|nr:outer membrane protein assembly factor BamD [Solimonas sp.]
MKQAFSLAAAALVLAACASDPNALPPANPFRPEQQSARELRLEASGLYKAARGQLESSDFPGAIQRYGQLMLRYPFTDYAVQAQLEKIYALYRNYEFDQALTDADRFLREHPRHALADYVQYLKGLVNFDRDENLSSFLGLDTTKQDVTFPRKSFDDFALLVQKYPSSRYAADARQRMIFLRNRIAQHELGVVQFYVRRGAYVAAAKRAEQIIAQYPGAPAALEALRLQEQCYRELGLAQQADDALKMRLAQSANEKPLEPDAWWKFW